MSEPVPEKLPREPEGQDIQPGIAEQDTILPVNPNNPNAASARDTISEIIANQTLLSIDQQRLKLAMRKAKSLNPSTETKNEDGKETDIYEAKPSEPVQRGNSFDKNIFENYFAQSHSSSKFSLSVVILFLLAVVITLLTKPKK